MKKLLLRTMLLLCALVVGSGSAWAEEKTLTFVQTSSTAGTLSGDVPTGVTATFKNTYATNKEQLTSGNSMTLTLSGWSADVTITGVTLEVKNNKSAGNGTATVTIGSTTLGTLSITGLGNTYQEKDVAITPTKTTSDLVITISATANSVYCDKFVISYSEPTDTRAATDITISDVGITNKDVYVSTAAGQLTAAVIAGPNTITDAIVTWESSNTDVATIAEDGTVTLVAAGETTIKASYAGKDGEYKPSSSTYTLTVTDSNPDVPGTENNPYTVKKAIDVIKAGEFGEGNYYVKGIVSKVSSTSVISGGYLTYYISDDGTTTNQLQVYKGKNKDNAAFTAVNDIEEGDNVIVVGPLTYYNNSTPEINTGNYIYSTDHVTLTVPELIVEDVNMEVSETKLVEDLYLTDSDGEVTVTSGNEAVAKIENGVLTAVGKGEATITVSVAKTKTHYETSKTFKVTVTIKAAVSPEGSSVASYFEKVTSADDLVDGDYLIVYPGNDTHASVAFNGALETLDVAKNGIAVTISENKIIADDNTMAAVFTWDSSAKTLTNKVGVAIGNSSYSNSLATGASGLTNTITFDESGNAVISAVESKSSDNYTTLRYNYASDQLRFRYYKSGQQAIQLYRLCENSVNSFDITIGDAGWRTLVTAQDVILPQGLTAYVVTATEDDKVTLQEAGSIKANNPYILNGAKGTYTLSIAVGVKAPAENLLQISTESTGNGVYVLAKPDGNEVGFYKWAGNSLGAGRVYLPAPSAGAPEFLGFVFDGETTGVKAIENGRLAIDNAVYNLAGQRVANPTKGLYIVNGKKVIIK